jgi:hypothetical protein
VKRNEWFNADLLSLNYNKTQYIQFRTKTDPHNEVIIGYDNNYISNNIDTKFLGIIIDSSLNWKAHILQLLKKLSKACYTMRFLIPIMSFDTLKCVYCSCFHSLIILYMELYSGEIFLLVYRYLKVKRELSELCMDYIPGIHVGMLLRT